MDSEERNTDIRSFKRQRSDSGSGGSRLAWLTPSRNYHGADLDTSERKYKALKKRKQREVDRYRQQRGISVKGADEAPDPIKSFAESEFPEYVIELLKAEFIRPTPIQAQVWPIALKGHDLLGIAEAGSGKTLAYLLPAILHVKSRPSPSRRGGPVVLVLASTPAHANQIQREYAKFCAASEIETILCHKFWLLDDHDRTELQKGSGILISTPLFVIDMIMSRRIDLASVSYLVLDDADRMLDLGLKRQIQDILSQISPAGQKLFFGNSPKEINKLSRLLIGKAYKVVIGSPIFKARHPIHQIVKVVNELQKQDRLLELLCEEMFNSRILIFMDRKKECGSYDQIAGKLCEKGWPAVSIHDGKSQVERDRIVSEFQDGKSPLMILTDGVARDLDFTDVKYVFNYDFPGSLDEYVHRIDCCGRSGAEGAAYTYFTAANARFAKELIILLKKSGHMISPELAVMGLDAPQPGRFVIPEYLVKSCAKLKKERRPRLGMEFPIEPVCVQYPEIRNAAWAAVEEVKKIMKRELHFVRVLEAYKQTSIGPYSVYYLTFEVGDAGDVANVVKACRAIVEENMSSGELLMPTTLFGLVNPDGCLTKLIGTAQIWEGEGKYWI